MIQVLGQNLLVKVVAQNDYPPDLNQHNVERRACMMRLDENGESLPRIDPHDIKNFIGTIKPVQNRNGKI
jgi:hypothetical protein